MVELDCRSLEYCYFPFDTSASRLVLCNSGVKHALGDTEYNKRREECAAGVAILQQHNPEIKSLRDATLPAIEAAKAELGEVIEKRCRYVVEENQRVRDLTVLLAEHQSLAGVGETALRQPRRPARPLPGELRPSWTHWWSLSRRAPGCFGARMMGGGFGGCTLNLVATGQVKEFLAHMKQGYQEQLGRQLETYVTNLADGVGEYLG